MAQHQPPTASHSLARGSPASRIVNLSETHLGLPYCLPSSPHDIRTHTLKPYAYAYYLPATSFNGILEVPTYSITCAGDLKLT